MGQAWCEAVSKTDVEWDDDDVTITPSRPTGALRVSCDKRPAVALPAQSEPHVLELSWGLTATAPQPRQAEEEEPDKEVLTLPKSCVSLGKTTAQRRAHRIFASLPKNQPSPCRRPCDLRSHPGSRPGARSREADPEASVVRTADFICEERARPFPVSPVGKAKPREVKRHRQPRCLSTAGVPESGPDVVHRGFCRCAGCTVLSLPDSSFPARNSSSQADRKCTDRFATRSLCEFADPSLQRSGKPHPLKDAFLSYYVCHSAI
ncbi:uncharacterized protein LOC107519011 [Rousettus aegyptiacus]|uniref:uncharacterized protein LOC107519011 n=1 Tax=Rousettus aegyptiacus TaxID=9407 RepID=UPI00168D5F6F|nr:uncharacterized protein LOC107519011 [Rousettus aegyptiacus]